MKSPFLEENSSGDTQHTDEKVDQEQPDFPTIYRARKSLMKRFLERTHTLFARILGRPDPYRPVPVTILTGFLGSGKTTIITNLMKELPADYRVSWLKNEFGNTAVDSELAEDNHVATVKEMLQGCICHVLIGQLSQALEELLSANPDRIIIETSGSATPAPIVWEIRKHPRLTVDGVITVIDAVNFPGYKNKSYTAKLQAKHTDMILINKHEQVTERQLDDVLDDVYELNLTTAKIKTDRGRVDPNIVFGLDSRLFETVDSVHNEERDVDKMHQHNEVDLIEIVFDKKFSRADFESALSHFSKKDFYRIKGVVRVDGKSYVLNWAFGSFSLIPISRKVSESKIVFMGLDIASFQSTIASLFSVSENDVVYTPAGHHDHGDEHEHEHEDDHEGHEEH